MITSFAAQPFGFFAYCILTRAQIDLVHTPTHFDTELGISCITKIMRSMHPLLFLTTVQRPGAEFGRFKAGG